MPDIIFHIGFPKTATSFLQRKIFHGKFFTMDNSISWDNDAKYAIQLQDFFLNHSPMIWGGEAKDLFKDHVARLNQFDRNILISHESLNSVRIFDKAGKTGTCYIAGSQLLTSHLQSIQHNIFKNIGKVKCFFFFRNQAEWLASYYAHVCYRRVHPSQNDFENAVRRILKEPYRYGGNVLHYDYLILNLVQALGKDNVLTLPFESFAENNTWEIVSDFCGLSIHPPLKKNKDNMVNSKRLNSDCWALSSRSMEKIAHTRFIYFLDNLFRSNKINLSNIIGLIEKKIKAKRKIYLNEEMRNQINEHFKDSNRRLNELLPNHNLADYGYRT